MEYITNVNRQNILKLKYPKKVLVSIYNILEKYNCLTSERFLVKEKTLNGKQIFSDINTGALYMAQNGRAIAGDIVYIYSANSPCGAFGSEYIGRFFIVSSVIKKDNNLCFPGVYIKMFNPETGWFQKWALCNDQYAAMKLIL